VQLENGPESQNIGCAPVDISDVWQADPVSISVSHCVVWKRRTHWMMSRHTAKFTKAAFSSAAKMSEDIRRNRRENAPEQRAVCKAKP
jgi:hypothetical protein